MARPLRIAYPGAFYHITSRGNGRKNIFIHDSDREKFLHYLQTASERYGAMIHVYCLMANHYHLLLETPGGNLSSIMHHINGAYTTYFNIKHKRLGHLMHGRYKSILVDKDAYAKELSRYIHLNPVHARIVTRPEDYFWSSYHDYLGLRESSSWLKRDFILSCFGPGGATSRKKYRAFIEGKAAQPDRDLVKEIKFSTFLGDDDFIDGIKRKYLDKKRTVRDLPAIKKLISRPTLEGIEEKVKAIFETDARLKKQVSLYLSQRFSGKGLKEIGLYYGIGESGVSQAGRRLELRLMDDMKLKRKVEWIKRELKVSKV